MKCYGCGQEYDPQEAKDRIRHQYHIGDSGLPRSRLLNMLSECQAERDDWYIRAVESQAEVQSLLSALGNLVEAVQADVSVYLIADAIKVAENAIVKAEAVKP